MFRLSIPVRQALARLILPVLALLSFALILIGKADVVAEQYVRSKLGDVLAPLYGAVSEPIARVRQEISDATGLWSMRQQNQALRSENERLLRWQAVALALDAQNQQLKTMAHWNGEASESFVTVPVVADTGGTYARSVLISTGPNSPVSKGQIALDAGGLVGRVTETGSRSARILLITDLNSRVPVMLAGSRGHALMVGTNDDRPHLMYWEVGSAPKEGEQIVTSAEAGAYPAGLPVGLVHYTGPEQAEVIPDADLARLELVRVVDYATVAVPPPDAAPAPAKESRP